ncbi:phage tail tape measure protein [Streptomyces sp. DSM 41524]|uniref:Phage tail tape measure protein n=1 Tax=Streptomyces asiaticus subsp. ignotus TaxID=3098222 RepID=A0ABU7Q9Y7_9ACTN|nr:phage tail tape measure protein [Streptomyces sp. DSM 41524]
MSLSIGELTGYVSLDVRDVDRGVSRTGQAMTRLRGQMTSDGDRAGQAAGQALGDGITRGADGRLRDARGRFVTAGRQAGDGFGDGLTDGVRQGADDAEGEATGMMGRLKLAAAGAGAAIGGALVEGFGQLMEQSQITGRLGAQLGATPAVAQRYGQIAGQMYADAVTEDFQGAADAISAVMRAGIAPPDATNAQIKSIATNVSDLASTFELDLGQTANAVGQMIKTGLAKDGTEAVDALTVGLQKMGPRADDIADTFNEYSTIFRQMGISATDATGLLSQGMKAGARDTDVVADSLKEFVLITQGGGKDVDAAFKKIGLSGSEMQKAFSKGGPEAKRALDQVFDGMRKVKSPTDRAQLALALFGTKAEDTQKALFSLDPSKAADSLGKVGGAADKMGNSLRDNAGVRVEQFKRRAMQGLVTFLGTTVVPALGKMFSFIQSHSGTFRVVGAVITGVLIPALVLMGIAATVRSAQVVAGWVRSGVAAVASAGRHALAAGRVVAAWVRMAGAAALQGARIAASAALSAARTAAAWALTAARMTATWLVSMLRVAATTIAQFALMAARAIAWAAVMAAQWLVAMGPIGWIIITVTALVALIIAKWDLVKQYTLAAWNAVKGWITTAVDGIVAAVNWLAQIPGKVAGWFGRAKDWAIARWNALVGWLKGFPGKVIGAIASLGGMLWSTVSSAGGRMVSAIRSKIADAINWVRGLPGRAKAALGNLGGKLWDSGVALIKGFIGGIKAMAGKVADAVGGVLSKARNLLPFSPAKEGPFSGRGYTTYSGRALMGGFAQGIAQQQGAVTAAMARVAQAGQDALTGSAPELAVGQGGTAALTAPRAGAPSAQTGGAAAQQQTPVVRVIVDASGGGDDLTRWLRKTVRVQGRGNVQVAFGGN